MVIEVNVVIIITICYMKFFVRFKIVELIADDFAYIYIYHITVASNPLDWFHPRLTLVEIDMEWKL